MLLTETLDSVVVDPRVAGMVADSLARGDRWVLATSAHPTAIVVVTLSPGHVASLVEMVTP